MVQKRVMMAERFIENRVLATPDPRTPPSDGCTVDAEGSPITNASYLAALLDRGTFAYRRSKRTGRVLHVGIRLTEVDWWAKPQWEAIIQVYNIEGKIFQPSLRGKSAKQGKVADPERGVSWALAVKDPTSVRKLLHIAAPHMWKRKEASEVMSACDELSGTKTRLKQ